MPSTTEPPRGEKGKVLPPHKKFLLKKAAEAAANARMALPTNT